MARILSQTLTRIPTTFTKRHQYIYPSSSRLVNRRSQSNLTEKAQLIEVELEPEAGEVEVLGLRRLEDAIHGIIVRRSAPDWLPFVPGSSYWVPPRKRPHGFVELFEKLANPLNQEENLSLSSARGFPCSSFFVDGASPYPVELVMNPVKEAQSEDDEA